MEIGTIFPVTSLSATTFSTISENRRQQNNSAQPDDDTVSLSPEALERARQSRLAAFCGTYGTGKLGETEGDAAGADEARRGSLSQAVQRIPGHGTFYSP